MANEQLLSLVSKGILTNSLGTIGVIVTEIEQGPVSETPPMFKGLGAEYNDWWKDFDKELEKAQKWVEIKFEYEGKRYTQLLYLDQDVEVKMEDLKVETVEKGIPKISIENFEHITNILEPKVTIEIG